MATYISRTPGSAGNRKKFTISMWVKRIKLGVDQWLVQAGASGSEFDIRFTTSDQIRFSTWDGSNGYGMITTRVFRDTSAWYHLVFQYDTAQATAANRNKIYVNGTQIDPDDTSAYNAGKHPPQNYDNPSWNNTAEFRINDVTWTSSSAKDALYSHIHHTDGYAYDASTFGSTDSTTGEWQINTSPSVTYGTNGFFILKDSASTTDQSGNSLTFSTSGTLTNSEDCPSNVFATLNPLTRQASLLTFSNGNTTMTTPSGTQFNTATSTLAMSSGKYYFEVKRIAERGLVGITNVETPQINGTAQYYNGDTANSNDYGYYSDDGKVYNNGNPSGSGATWGNGDIVGCAVDLDNRKIYWHKNGTYINSGNPSAGSGGQTIPSDLTYYFAVSGYTSTTFQCNFGDGFFGTTAISSEGSNASNIGKFEYDVPTGYTALSTKGLNE